MALTATRQIICLLLLKFVDGFLHLEPRGISGDSFDDENGTNGTNTTATTPSNEPILSAEAIANIILTGIAIIVLTSCLCFQMHWYNISENRNRVKLAQERNRQIDRQLAADRAKQQAKEAEVKTGLIQDIKEPEPLKKNEEVTERTVINEEGFTVGSGGGHMIPLVQEAHMMSGDVQVTSSDIVVDLEEENADGVVTDIGGGQNEANLVDISLDDVLQQEPPILLVKPAEIPT